MGSRLGGTGAALCGLLLLAQRATATELDWSAPESCSRDGFLQQVEDNLQQPLAELTLARLRVSVAQPARSQWTLQFSLSESGSEAASSRTLTGSSCDDVSRAGAVAVAMALHSRAEQAKAAELAAAAPSAEAPSAEAPSAIADAAPYEPAAVTSVSADPAPPAAPYRWPLQLSLLGDVSLLGTPSFGVAAGLGLGRGRWEATLSAAVLPTIELRTGDALGLSLGAVLGLASSCFDLGGPPATPRACLGYELGVVRGEGSGSGLRVTREQRAVWHALRPELGLAVPLGLALELRLCAGAALGLSRAQFVYDEGRVAHELPRVSARGSLGLAWLP